MKGTVTKKGNKWYVVLELGNDPVTGKRKQKWIKGGDTKKAANALLDHKKHQALEASLSDIEQGDNGLVLTSAQGQPMSPFSLRDAFLRYVEKAQVPRIRFHDLRHTHASLMLQQGVHPKVVSERLGHSNTNITMNLYSHVLPGMQEQAAEGFEDALKTFRDSNVRKSLEKGNDR